MSVIVEIMALVVYVYVYEYVYVFVTLKGVLHGVHTF